MNIIYIINALEIGGAERLLVEALPEIKLMGNEVKVILLFSKTNNFIKQIQNAGIEIAALNLRHGVYDPSAIMHLHLLIKDADVVHSHLFPSQYWAALAHCCIKKGILVTTEHSTSNTRAKYWLTTQIDKCIYGLYDGIICISEATADFMRKRTPHKVTIKVIENGVRLPSISTQKDLNIHRKDIVSGLSDTNFVLLQVARFSTQKNQDCLIRALKLLPDNIHVLFAGYGKREEVCRQLAEKEGVSERTHFLGMREDIAQLWSIADLGVMSSHWEGFGLAAVEGMAYAKPVIASNVPGLAEVVGNKQLLFSPNDEHELAVKILQFYNDKKMLKDIGIRCQKQASKFDIKNMAAQYVDFYKQLLKQKKDKQ